MEKTNTHADIVRSMLAQASYYEAIAKAASNEGDDLQQISIADHHNQMALAFRLCADRVGSLIDPSGCVACEGRKYIWDCAQGNQAECPLCSTWASK